ncbi:MAG: hypothetical protein EPN82_09955 [Bacteroidetes bacterium]|nr:MAG: hypothetical protein EPN82_09955 [Bacteroidota bacterium]
MGQLINRLSRFIKSEFDDSKTSSYKLDEYPDEELKRIIDELNNDKSKEKSSYKYKTGTNKKEENKKDLTLDKAYSIFGLKQNATTDEIKSAYKQKIKEYHPDRVANLGSELKQLAEQKTQEINMAYEIIKKHRAFN